MTAGQRFGKCLLPVYRNAVFRASTLIPQTLLRSLNGSNNLSLAIILDLTFGNYLERSRTQLRHCDVSLPSHHLSPGGDGSPGRPGDVCSRP